MKLQYQKLRLGSFRLGDGPPRMFRQGVQEPLTSHAAPIDVQVNWHLDVRVDCALTSESAGTLTSIRVPTTHWQSGGCGLADGKAAGQTLWSNLSLTAAGGGPSGHLGRSEQRL